MNVRSVVKAIISLVVLGFIIFGCLNRCQENRQTKVYKIVENNTSFESDDFSIMEIKRGTVYIYLDVEMKERIKTISSDSTYFYNTTNEDWLLYSVDYKASGKDVTIPEEIYVIIPPHTMLGYSKIRSYIHYEKPSQEETLYGYDAEKGYKRNMYLRKASIVFEESAAIEERRRQISERILEQLLNKGK